MITMKKIFYFTLAALAFVACADDTDPEIPVVEYNVISFESAEKMIDIRGEMVKLGDLQINGYATATHHKVFAAKKYMNQEDATGSYFDDLLFATPDQHIKFGSYFTDNKKSSWGPADVWGGFALSANYDKTPAAASDYSKQFAVWSMTGANNTPTFAICYDNGYGAYHYHTPKISFDTPHTVAFLYLANATVTGQYKPAKADFSFAVKITGFLGGKEGKSVEQVLMTKTATSDWVKVDLSGLGKVDLLQFKVICNDAMAPTYFCVDEISLLKNK